MITGGRFVDGFDAGHSLDFVALLRGALMHRWISLVGAMMLVLMLWTGGAAHAAERFDCIPVSVEAAGHFDGDRDEAPSGQGQGVAHHHSGCSGHHLASPAGTPDLSLGCSIRKAPVIRHEAGMTGLGPDSHLRPPID